MRSNPSKIVRFAAQSGVRGRFFEMFNEISPFFALVLFYGCGSSSTPAGGPDDAAIPETASDAASDTANEGASASSDGSRDDEGSSPEGGGNCPPTPPAGASCTASCTAAEMGANCSYGSECCVCSPEAPYWMCAQTTLPAPCPASPPAAGSSCNADANCIYCLVTGLVVVDCAVGSAGTGQWNVSVGPRNPGNGCTLPGEP